MKYLITNNPCSVHSTYWGSQRPRAPSLSATCKQAEEEITNLPTAPSAAPASTLLTTRESVAIRPCGRLQSRTYRRARVPAGGAGWPAGSRVTNSSSTASPGSPCLDMVQAALCHTRSTPADGWTDGQTAGQRHQACGDLWAGQARLQGCSPRVDGWD